MQDFEDPRAGEPAGVDVGEGHADAVVEVQAEGEVGVALEDRADAGADLARARVADAVGDRDLGDAEGDEAVDHPHDAIERDLALVGAGEADAHADRDLGAGAGAERDDRLDLGEVLRDRHVRVLALVGLGGDDEAGELGHAGRDRALGAAEVRDERPDRHALEVDDAGGDLGRVGERRDRARVDEAGDLDLGHAGRGDAADEGDLVGGGRRGPAGLVHHGLEAVAGQKFDDAGLVRHAHGSWRVRRGARSPVGLPAAASRASESSATG